MQSQTRNWILFFLSVVVIFFGYNSYLKWRFPPPKQLPEEDKPKVEALSRALALSVPSGGLGDAARVAAAVEFNYEQERELVLVVLKDKEEERKKQAAAKAPEPVKPVKPDEKVSLGGDGYYLAATLTNRGAGVHELTVAPFKAADWFGLPAKGPDGQPLPLQLIPPSDVPSFALYHFATTDENDLRPLDTLGVRDWEVVEKKTDIEEQRVAFATELPEFGVRIVKTFTLRPNEYHLGLSVRVERLPGAKDAKPFRYQLTGAHGLPIEGVWYTTIFRNALFSWVNSEDANIRNLADSRSIVSTNGGERIPGANSRLQYAAVAIQYFASAIVVAEDQKNFVGFVRATNEVSVTAAEIVQRLANPALSEAEKRQLLATAVPGMSPEVIRLLIAPGLDGLWQTIQDNGLPDNVKAKLIRESIPDVRLDSALMKALLESGLTEPERRARLVADQIKPQLADITVRVISKEIKAEESVDHKFLLYHGPVKVGLLEKFDKGRISPELAERYKNLRLNTLTDYGTFSGGFFSFWTDFIIFFTNAVHWLIGILRPICIYDGICIIVVTVLVRLAMMPVSRRQAATLARTQEAMAKIKPEVAKLNERFKNDLVAKQQAQMELYRKHGVNPAAGLGGCLMLFVQMPIFLGLYFALQESFFFRLEPFLWIRNLAAPDMLLWWSEKIPFISDPASMGTFFYLGPFFNLLPILSLTLMFIQMKWMQPPPADEQAAQQQKMTQYIMIPMFAFLFYKMPSGLCIYFISSTAWALAERKWLPKKKPAAPEAVSGNGRPGPRGKGRNQPTPPPGKIRSWWEKVLKEAQKK